MRCKKPGGFIPVDSWWFNSAPGHIRLLHPQRPSIMMCPTSHCAITEPKLQQTMTGFSTFARGERNSGAEEKKHCFIMFSGWFFFPVTSLPSWLKTIKTPAQLLQRAWALPGRLRSPRVGLSDHVTLIQDFININLHTPGDLPQYDFLYLRVKKKNPTVPITSFCLSSVELFFFPSPV